MPDFVDDAIAKAHLAQRGGDHALAEAVMRDAVRRSPSDPWAVVILAQVIRFERPDEAASLARHARSLAPGDHGVAVIAGRLLFDVEAYEEAYDVYLALSSMAGELPEPVALGVLDLGARFGFTWGKLTETRPLLEELMRRDPARHGVAEMLAITLIELDDERAAEAVLAKGLEHRPGEPDLVRIRAALRSDGRRTIRLADS